MNPGEIRSSSRYGGEYGVGTTSGHFRDRLEFDGNMFLEPRRDRSEPRAPSKGKGKKHTSIGSSSAVVYYKFKSSKDSHSLPIDGPFISLSDFKHQIFASERYGNGNDFDLLISDSKIDQKLANGSSLILTNSFLLIRRVPQPPGLPIAIGGEEKPNIQCNSPSILVKEELQEQGFDFDDFGLDFTSISNNSIAKPGDTHCKETKIDHGFKILSVKTLGKWRASNTSDSSSKSSGISYASISTTSSSCGGGAEVNGDGGREGVRHHAC
ncbi:hypothetical protein PVK06_017749 [Gossypium arboreum]|uniref:DWNN domain-containing protein n=1 Tax=Gossypium arboreum TaxID=29729 RepID=A0ABR0Q4H3_GOSAR|nr:hypothetical protein PVK06_017749 [Gossypium arboreum]